MKPLLSLAGVFVDKKLRCVLTVSSAAVSVVLGVGFSYVAFFREMPNERVREMARSVSPETISRIVVGLPGYNRKPIVVTDPTLVRRILTALQSATMSGGPELDAATCNLNLYNLAGNSVGSVELYNEGLLRNIGPQMAEPFQQISRDQAQQLSAVLKNVSPSECDIYLDRRGKVPNSEAIPLFVNWLASGDSTLFSFLHRSDTCWLTLRVKMPAKMIDLTIGVELPTDKYGDFCLPEASLSPYVTSLAPAERQKLQTLLNTLYKIHSSNIPVED